MTLLLVDLSSISHQISKSSSGLSTSTNIPTSHIYSFLKKIPRIKEMGVEFVVFCLDAGHTKRDEISKNYKANRGSSTSRIVSDLLPILKNLPVVYCVKKGYEADDLLYTLACELHDETDVILLSKDYDVSISLYFYPSVRHFFTFDQEITPQNLFMRFGCYADKLALHKAIFGDRSDNIIGVKLGRNKKVIQALFSEFDLSGKDILKRLPKEALSIVRRNLKLISPQVASNVVYATGSPSKDGLTRYLNKYEIASLTAEDLLHNFPFNKKLQSKVIKVLNET